LIVKEFCADSDSAALHSGQPGDEALCSSAAEERDYLVFRDSRQPLFYFFVQRHTAALHSVARFVLH
jgi:hypothetical protein